MWSWRFLPTPGRSWTTAMPSGCSSSAGPIPDSSSSRGELTAPPLKISSRSTCTCSGFPSMIRSRPVTRPFSHEDLAGQRMGDDVEVLPRPGRFQVRRSSALAASVLLGDVVPADALLRSAVEIGDEVDAELLGGAYERLAQRIVLNLLRDIHCAHTAVVAVVEALIGLGPPEERQHLVISPVFVAELRPRLVVLFLPADVDHRVDRGATAQGAALWVPHRSVVQLGLWDGGELPVVARATELGEANGHVDQRRPVLSAGL